MITTQKLSVAEPEQCTSDRTALTLIEVPEPFDRTAAQVIADHEKHLRDRASKLVEVQAFLVVLQELLDAGELHLTGNSGVMAYAFTRLKTLSAS